MSGLEWQISTLHLKMANAFRFGTPEFMRRTRPETQINQQDTLPSGVANLLLGKVSNTECPYPTLRGDSALATNR